MDIGTPTVNSSITIEDVLNNEEEASTPNKASMVVPVSLEGSTEVTSEIIQSPVSKECDNKKIKELDAEDWKKSSELNSNNILSRRTRCRPNKSIIESAIARKEQYFEPYEKPRVKRGPRTKPKLNPDELDNNISPAKIMCITESKSDSVAAESVKTDSTSSVRKSPRKLASDCKKNIGGERDNDETIKEKLASRMCKCTEDKELYMKQPSAGPHFCSAIDSIDNKLFGCSKEVDVNNETMLRPSTRVSFGLFCESHKKRLIKHNCCSICGTFCTQGDFLECASKHHYHDSCKLSLNGKCYCPHCGSDSVLSTTTHIKMSSAITPVFMPVQRSHSKNAKISCSELKNIKKPMISDLFPNLIEKIRKLRTVQYGNLNNVKTDDLIESIINHDAEKVFMILERNCVDLKIKLKDHNQGTFLHLAASKGNQLITHLLATNPGINGNCLDAEQYSALMVAILEQNNETVEYLVRIGGADVTLKGIDGMTALHLAAKVGNEPACKYILETAIDPLILINVQDDGGWTPLVWACEHGHGHLVKYLISRGADINIRDVEQNVALHWAAFKGGTQVVQLLLGYKADINVVNAHGDTPLHICARVNHYGCVIYLLTQKADFSIINKNNEIPYDCAPHGSACSVLLANRLKNESSDFLKSSLVANDISRGRELNPIQSYNDIDDKPEPEDYSYITKNCITSDLHVNMNIKAMKPCICVDRCNSLSCTCAKLSLRCWYGADGKLVPEFNFSDPPLIFECNDLCNCNKILCNNRLIQKPLSQRFQLFRTESKGWGIKCLNFIPMGSYVCEYIGELMTDVEAELREDDSYLFDLDNKETDSYAIDAKFYGNFARFINHSCDPNLHPVKVFVDHHDLRFPRIALFAKKDIKADEELSFDYGEKFWLVKYKSFTCDCRASTCKYSKEAIGKILEKYHM
ncbi:histone-lysine N-methyltransferase EHMT2-like isoform X1 [Anthonomus grandis grandis]|uniref:histone-lysine N-methyltransferase EHMT2-like isoform X1 n=1 Tax=Anthonomus grandis grandis TaxID=2921223 RepID=UPI00216516A2|nr:histone-lysine N-methyltransferase EHMT2-like isoform X1 [Anthonomus grandis grandis]